jgi:hypothetical protein
MVKVKVKVNFTLEQATKAKRKSRGARWGLVFNTTPRPLYARERDQVPIV